MGRKGSGKFRHVRVGQLWVQEKADSGDLRYRKVKGEENIANLLTKPLKDADVQKFMNMTSMCTMEGGAHLALDMAGVV